MCCIAIHLGAKLAAFQAYGTQSFLQPKCSQCMQLLCSCDANLIALLDQVYWSAYNR